MQGRKQNLKVCLTSQDVEKAFDRVWQRGLKYKLSQLDLHPALLRILANYLDNRTAKIQIANQTGLEFPIESGVPQGGCLSTTLYSVYTRDIPETTYPWTHNTYYADDITQIVRGTTYSEIKHAWSIETNNINNFKDRWMIKTNMQKFKLLDFGAVLQRTFEHRGFNLNCTTTKEAKILGFNLTSNGMKKHIQSNINKAKIQLAKLQKFRNLSYENKRKLYLMLVRPQLLYPCIPLQVSNNSQMMQLQRVQNKGITFMLGRGRARHETTELRHQLVNLEPINMILQQRATRIWNTIFDSVDEDIINKLWPENINRRPRNRQEFPSSLEKREAIASPFFTVSDERWIN